MYRREKMPCCCSFQGDRQGRAAAHRFADAFDDLACFRRIRQLQHDAERPVERLAGGQQRGQLLGELQHLRGVEVALAPEREQRAPLARGVGAQGLHRQVTLVLQPDDDFVGIGRFHLAFQAFAGRGQRFVGKQRHFSLPASPAGPPRSW
jgi:hypothetical protein